MTQPMSRGRIARRAALAATVAIATVLTTAACTSGGGGSTKADPKADVTLTWWTGQDDQAEKLLTGLAADFHKLHPNVTINVSAGASTTADLLQKLSAGFASGKYPDISYAYGSWASQLESSGKMQDITDKVKDPAVKWSEFTAAARGTAQPTGKATIGFPAVVDNLSLIYNKTVFDKAGVQYPTDKWTWDDFRTAAKKLTDPATQTYGYSYQVDGSEETTWQFWPHLWQNGGSIIDKTGTKAEFDSAAGVKALDFLRSMAVDDKSVYLDQTGEKYAQLFASDRIGMMTSGPWQLYDLKTAGTKYGVVPLPGTNGSHQTVSGPDIWALPDSGDANRDYWAYTFTEWLTSAPQDLKWNVAYGDLPLRSSETSSPEFAAQVAQYPGLDVMAANGANATTPRPTVPGYVGLSSAIGTAISNVLQGQGTASDALKAAQQQADKALANG